MKDLIISHTTARFSDGWSTVSDQRSPGYRAFVAFVVQVHGFKHVLQEIGPLFGVDGPSPVLQRQLARPAVPWMLRNVPRRLSRRALDGQIEAWVGPRLTGSNSRACHICCCGSRKAPPNT